jgi:hypothetical protein
VDIFKTITLNSLGVRTRKFITTFTTVRHWSYAEQIDSTLHSPSQSPQDLSRSHPPIYASILQVVSFLRVFPPKPCKRSYPTRSMLKWSSLVCRECSRHSHSTVVWLLLINKSMTYSHVQKYNNSSSTQNTNMLLTNLFWDKTISHNFSTKLLNFQNYTTYYSLTYK